MSVSGIFSKQTVNENENLIFISHSSKDKEIVSVFIDKILKLTLKIDSENIFCTSIHENSIRSGADFRNEIKKHLAKAKLVIQIITKNYKESEVCLNEMGAAWALDNKVMPFILPPITYDSVGFIHKPNQLMKLNRKEDILKFIGEEKSDYNKIKPVEIERHVNEFLAYVESKIEIQPISKVVIPEIKNVNELGLVDNDVVEIENREGLYLFKNGKLKHILDDSKFSLYIYGLDTEEVKSIKYSDAANIIDKKHSIPSLYNCKILIDEEVKKRWLLVDHERRFLPAKTYYMLITKVKSENLLFWKHKAVMEIPEGDKLRDSDLYSE